MDGQRIMDIAKDCWRIEAEQIARLSDSMGKEVGDVVGAIAACKGKVIVSGCGTSGAAARKIAHSLSCVERPALFLSPADAVHGALGVLQRDDILVLISKGGNTAEIINLIPACKTKGAMLIGMTENESSALARESDILLKVRAEREPCPFNMLATASTMLVVAVFDAICIALMHETGYTKEQFAVIHPGGVVGEKLLNK